MVRLIHPVTGLTPGQILGDYQTNGLDLGELMQYRTAGLLALGIKMRSASGTKNRGMELSEILGTGIA